MNELIHNFNAQSLPMHYARDRRTGNLVSLPGDIKPDIDWYNDNLHKGHLTCEGCDVPVHFNKGSETTDGSRHEGARPHFKTNPGRYHADDCGLGKIARKSRQLSGGFRLNLNTSTSDYYHERIESILPPGLQAISLKTMFEQAAFMRTQDIGRITKSFAVFREHESAWKNYM